MQDTRTRVPRRFEVPRVRSASRTARSRIALLRGAACACAATTPIGEGCLARIGRSARGICQLCDACSACAHGASACRDPLYIVGYDATPQAGGMGFPAIPRVRAALGQRCSASAPSIRSMGHMTRCAGIRRVPGRPRNARRRAAGNVCRPPRPCRSRFSRSSLDQGFQYVEKAAYARRARRRRYDFVRRGRGTGRHRERDVMPARWSI